MFIGFGSQGNFSVVRGNGSSFFVSSLATCSLTRCCFLEGSSGELLIFHDLGSYVISRRDNCREDFDATEGVDNSSKGNFKW